MPEDDVGTLTRALEQFYDDYRTVALTKKYYARQLTWYRRWNTALELTLAFGTSGAVGAWAAWHTPTGQRAWPIIAGCSAVIAIAKPILQLSKSIERYSKLFIAYNSLCLQLSMMVSDIRVTASFPAHLKLAWDSARVRFTELALDDDPQPNQRTVNSLYDQVNDEIPVESLWIPNERGAENDQ